MHLWFSCIIFALYLEFLMHVVTGHIFIWHLPQEQIYPLKDLSFIFVLRTTKKARFPYFGSWQQWLLEQIERVNFPIWDKDSSLTKTETKIGFGFTSSWAFSHNVLRLSCLVILSSTGPQCSPWSWIWSSPPGVPSRSWHWCCAINVCLAAHTRLKVNKHW